MKLNYCKINSKRVRKDPLNISVGNTNYDNNEFNKIHQNINHQTETVDQISKLSDAILKAIQLS